MWLKVYRCIFILSVRKMILFDSQFFKNVITLIKLHVMSKKGWGVRWGVGLTTLIKKFKKKLAGPSSSYTWQRSFLSSWKLSAGTWVFWKAVMSSVFPLAATVTLALSGESRYVVNIKPPPGRWHHYLSCLSIPSPWTSAQTVLIITLLEPFRREMNTPYSQ